MENVSIDRLAKVLLKSRAPGQTKDEWAKVAVRNILVALRNADDDLLDAADDAFHDAWRRARELNERTGREGYGSGMFSEPMWRAMFDYLLAEPLEDKAAA